MMHYMLASLNEIKQYVLVALNKTMYYAFKALNKIMYYAFEPLSEIFNYALALLDLQPSLPDYGVLSHISYSMPGLALLMNVLF